MYSALPLLFTLIASAEPTVGTATIQVVEDEDVTFTWKRLQRAFDRAMRRWTRRTDKGIAEPPPEEPELPDALPIPGATVVLSGPEERECETDGGGICRFEDLPPGTYQVWIEHASFVPTSHRQLVVQPDTGTRMVFGLRTLGGETVIIT